MVVSLHVYCDNLALLYVVHCCIFISEPRTHNIGPFEHELDGPFIGCEPGVEVWVGVYGLQCRDDMLFSVDEVNFLVDNYVVGFSIVS